MKNLLLLTLCLFLVQRQTLARPSKIAYLSAVPADVERLTPAGVKSMFWGTFRLPNTGPLCGIRLYDCNWKLNYKNGDAGKPVTIYADIFVKRSESWRRLRHCRWTYQGGIRKKMQIELALLWLDPRREQRPIFRIRAFCYEPMGGPVEGGGDEVLVVFPQGLQRGYRVQAFTTGYWRASDTLGRNLFYTTTDKRGLLEITANEALNDDIYCSRTTTYQWKLARFVAVSQSTEKCHIYP